MTVNFQVVSMAEEEAAVTMTTEEESAMADVTKEAGLVIRAAILKQHGADGKTEEETMEGAVMMTMTTEEAVDEVKAADGLATLKDIQKQQKEDGKAEAVIKIITEAGRDGAILSTMKTAEATEEEDVTADEDGLVTMKDIQKLQKEDGKTVDRETAVRVMMTTEEAAEVETATDAMTDGDGLEIQKATPKQQNVGGATGNIYKSKKAVCSTAFF